MKLLKRILPLLLLPVLAAAAAGQGAFALKEGDRVVFYGDSITDQRQYTVFTETYVVTRFPHRNITFIHSGWGGDRVTGGGGGPIDLRLDRDVIAYRPTVMTIMLGMNDGSYRAFDQTIFDTYANGYRHIIDRVKSALPGLRLTLIQPSPYDDVTRNPGFPGGYNAVLVKYGEYVRTLATDGATVADLNGPVVEALQKANSLDSAAAQKLIPDRVHPGPGGHMLMAEALLKAWNAPAIVSEVEIDAGRKRVTVARNTKVRDLTAARSLSWTQADEALPFPIDLNDPTVVLAVRASDFVQALDSQPLRVTGLQAARYQLKIDGDDIGTYTKEQLSGGVNLAPLATPMSKQAMAVHLLTKKHNDLHFLRWRQLQVPMQQETYSHMSQALGGLDALEGDIVAAQRAAAQPKARRYELTPVD